MVLPLSVISICGDFFERQPAFEAISENGIVWGQTDIRPIILLFVMQLTLSIILIWGIACTLVVGKRMIKSKAGRSRTSFAVVRKDGAKYVLNLFITGILRNIFTFFWGLLLIIPGIIYAIRTAFYHVVIVCEDSGYRASLNKSKEVVKGYTWTVLLYFLGLAVVIFLPVIIISGILGEAAAAFDQRLLPGIYIIVSVLMSLAILLFTLATILLYAEIKKLPKLSTSTNS
ncbi:hypothetical protein KKC44_01040 [Patescibacteria group bacterium]|nr:hypothetical protein [Patescibacteria group bacterium]MBU2259168.1 hypothetical protein [Patescibacteria group bacterium]